MSEPPSHEDRDESVRYDNWPVEGKSEQEIEWLGMVGGAGGAPALYEPHTNVIYQGTIDETNERIVPDPETERQVSSNETIGEVLQDIADSHDWQSLSTFAAEHMGVETDEDDQQGVVEDTTFQQRNVAAAADHQLGFFGSSTYEGEDGVHTIEHEFHVSTSPESRENGKPTAEIETDHLRTGSVDDAIQGNDAELIAQDHHEIIIDIDPELTGRRETGAIEEYCQAWHENAVQS
jgi:hypothetical protein